MAVIFFKIQSKKNLKYIKEKHKKIFFNYLITRYFFVFLFRTHNFFQKITHLTANDFLVFRKPIFDVTIMVFFHEKNLKIHLYLLDFKCLIFCMNNANSVKKCF